MPRSRESGFAVFSFGHPVRLQVSIVADVSVTEDEGAPEPAKESQPVFYRRAQRALRPQRRHLEWSGFATYLAICSPVANQTPGFDFM